MEKENTFLTREFDSSRDWEGRHTAGYVVFKNRMWIVGGDPIQKHYQNDVWSSENGKNWQCVTRPKFRGDRVFFTILWPSEIASGSWLARHCRNSHLKRSVSMTTCGPVLTA